MKLDFRNLYRVGRWLLMVPWVAMMDDGCAALDIAKEKGLAAQVSAPIARPLPGIKSA